MNHIFYYLLFVLKNEQAVRNVLNDFEATKVQLSHMAGSLKLCENLRLRARGYRIMEFQKHDYFLLYRIEENSVIIDAVYHELQDFENKIK